MESTPRSETTRRVSLLQRRLAEEGLALALIRQAADLFYYTGTLADGFLAVAPDVTPQMLVRRPLARVKGQIPWPVLGYRDLKELPGLLKEAGFTAPGPVGLELDVMPAALYLQMKERFFPSRPVLDLSPLIRPQRMIKSAYEIDQLRRAAAILDETFTVVPELLKPGVTELELAAALENRLRLLGHQGLVRVRQWNLEQFYGHVMSGLSGLEGAYMDTPSGGRGFSPAFPQGASFKKLAPGEPISVDLVACLNGYMVDMTRMYAIQSLPPKAWEAYRLVEELYGIFEAQTRPGAECGSLFHRLWDAVRTRGWQTLFMGQAPDQVKFLAHGVGLELDEYPVLAARFPYPLEADMVMAFEPKFFVPDLGMIGQEDTCRLTPDGMEWLTQTPREVVVVD
jgi:Xaa-Pro dipeptidase